MGARPLPAVRQLRPVEPFTAVMQSPWDPEKLTAAQWRTVSSAMLKSIRALTKQADGFAGGDILNVTVAAKPVRLKGKPHWRYTLNLWRYR